MEARFNVYGGAILALAVLTCIAAFKVTALGFFDRAPLCYYAFLAGALVVAVFVFETPLSVHQWPFLRMKFLWPIALVGVWVSFHEVLQYWGMPEQEVDIFGQPIPIGFESEAWYASDLVFGLGVIAILAYGYIGDRYIFSEQ